MKKINLLAAVLTCGISYAQVAFTSFEEEVIEVGVNNAEYFDLGDPNVAHDLVNNPFQTPVDQSGGTELSADARYEPYDTPSVGSTDGDLVGVTNTKPSADIDFTDGNQGYRMSDLDGNFILEFATVDLTGVTNPFVFIDYILSINATNPANGNYEGDGTVNTMGSDRLRIYVRDLTNSNEIDIVNSTGSDLDDLVPFDATTNEYQLQWQTGSAELIPGTTVQLVIEARTNAISEAFWFDNIIFDGLLGTNNVQESQFVVYPNPATRGYVNITSQESGIKEVAVYNVLGKQVINTRLNGDRLDISNLNSGVYIVKIIQGDASTTKKLVVK